MKCIIILFLGVWSVLLYAKDFDLNRCTLLPILDEQKLLKGEQDLRRDLEAFLTNESWCIYPGKMILADIFKRYQGNLQEHLFNEEVLHQVAKVEHSGSLIRIRLAQTDGAVFVEVSVLAEDGKELYFQERSYKEQLKENSNLITEEVKKMLQRYGETLPYDGLISFLDENHFSAFVAKGRPVKNGDVIIIKRLQERRGQEWITQKVGNAKVIAKSDQKVFAKIDWEDRLLDPVIGDWLKFYTPEEIEKDEQQVHPEEFHEYKKRGRVFFSSVFGYGATSNMTATTGRRLLGGLVTGVETGAQLWMKNLKWGTFLQYGNRPTFYKRRAGVLAEDAVLTNERHEDYKLLATYRHFPKYFFYEAQIQYYLGYARYNYDMDYVEADGFTSLSFWGPLVGVSGNFMLAKNLRLFGRFELIPFIGQYSEKVKLYGRADSVTSYQMELGGSRVMSRNIALNLGIQWTSNKAQFKAPVEDVHFEEYTFKMGVSIFL